MWTFELFVAKNARFFANYDVSARKGGGVENLRQCEQWGGYFMEAGRHLRQIYTTNKEKLEVEASRAKSLNYGNCG